jgi:hypothetical protein
LTEFERKRHRRTAEEHRRQAAAERAQAELLRALGHRGGADRHLIDAALHEHRADAFEQAASREDGR